MMLKLAVLRNARTAMWIWRRGGFNNASAPAKKSNIKNSCKLKFNATGTSRFTNLSDYQFHIFHGSEGKKRSKIIMLCFSLNRC